jgi:NADP-dependent 3-hydroxy acid dehydrogenase YdfG
LLEGTIVDLFSLKGKNIAITGASSGFGHHFAGVLSGAGANVILGARRADKIADRVSEIIQSGGQALGIPLDVTIPDSCADFLHQAEEAFGPVDVLINNAGVEAGAKT